MAECPCRPARTSSGACGPAWLFSWTTLAYERLRDGRHPLTISPRARIYFAYEINRQARDPSEAPSADLPPERRATAVAALDGGAARERGDAGAGRTPVHPWQAGRQSDGRGGRCA